MVFKNRAHAGRELSKHIDPSGFVNPIVLALPRGGVPVGYEIAQTFHVPLDVIVVRKLGAPGQEEFGIGAIAENNVRVLDNQSIALLGISTEYVDQVSKQEEEEMLRRIQLYRNGKPLPSLNGRTVILSDDGLATGVTARAAIEAVKKQHPERIIFAIPVCAWDTATRLSQDVDSLICVLTPYDFLSVGSWYQEFDQVTDDEVKKLLDQARSNMAKTGYSYGH